MATYYIRKTGSDSNAGTSAGAAWLTLGKAFGVSGMLSGDTVYIGAGVYRELVSFSLTPTAETKIIGDVDGSHTGDAGEVHISAYLTNDTTIPSSTQLVNLNGKSFLTFQDLVFQTGLSAGILGSVTTSHDIKLIRCLITAGGQASNTLINISTAANVALNWTIDSCVFQVGTSGSCFFCTPARPSGADLNLNVVIKNCLFITGSSAVINLQTPSGANTFNPGGVTAYNCTHIGAGVFMSTTGANWSTSIPCAVYNCFLRAGNTSFSAAASGQILEDYNLIMGGSTPRTNVTAGSHSISDGSYSPMIYCGHEFISTGSNLMPFGMPKPNSAILAFGNKPSGSPTVDILGVARPSGSIIKLDTGTATAGAAKTLTNSGKTWGTNVFAGYTVKIISGTGNGQVKSISSNTATVLTVDGNWKTNPDSTSVYEIYSDLTSSGKATAGSTTTLTDANAAWGTNMWQGYVLNIDSGTGSGQSLIVISNTATVITFATATAPDSTSTYKLYVATNENTIQPSVGCYELGNTAVQETGTVRTGSNSIRIAGAGYVDFSIPVDASSTTVTVYAQYDAAYSGTLPSMNIINGTECGVSNASATQAGSSGTWEQLSINFTPTAKGIVTVRLVSATTTPTGNAFFDDFNVS